MMTEHNDPPPPYSGYPSLAATPTAPPLEDAEEPAATDTSQQAMDLEERQLDGQGQQSPTDMGYFEGSEAHVEGTLNASNSFSGFIDILYEKKKLPPSFPKNIIYKLGLTIFYLVHFIHSIVSVAMQGDHVAFHLFYVLISLVGLAFKLFIMINTIRKCITTCTSKRDENDTAERSPDGNSVTTPNPNDDQRAHEQVLNYRYKGKRVLKDYVLSSLGEFLIYPILVCVLYGFINERAWRFDNGLSISYTVLLVYSVLMDALYMKLYVIFLVMRALRATYKKYDKLAKPTELDWKRYFTPVYLSIPLAIITAITHWLMTSIMAGRIYIDNFSGKIDDTNASIPDTGDYRVAPFTGYMIACAIYLPIVSWITYIMINKLWFYEVYSAIYQLDNGVGHMPKGDKWSKKLFAFIKDPLAYIAIVFLIPPYVTFAIATYLPDYDSSELEVTSTARDVIEALGSWFIISFLISNLQAVITFTLILCGLPVCVLVYKLCQNR